MATVRDLRLDKNMSQAELAVKAGITTSVISRMETGKPVQSLSFKTVCMVLGVRPEDVDGVNIYSALRRPARAKR